MKIEFDVNKNYSNISKHGLDFNDVILCDWQTAFYEQLERFTEIRYKATVMFESRLCVIAFVWRKDKIRVISFRKANKRERNKYDKAV
jgi:uncharacterized DUF497 family protein